MTTQPIESPRIAPALVYLVALLLVVAGVALIIQSERDYRAQVTEDTRAKAEILAASVVAALDFGDRQAAQDAVDAYAVNRRVSRVDVRDRGGRVLAAYVRKGAGSQGGTASVQVPVTHENMMLGTVSVAADRDPIRGRVLRYLTIVLLVTFAALLITVMGLAQAASRRANQALQKNSDELAAAYHALQAEVAERETAEAGRSQADALYRAYWENTSEHLFVVDVTDDNRFVYQAMNPACADTTGLSTAMAGGKEPAEVFDAEMAAEVQERYRRCVETGRVQHYPETLRLPAGVRSYETLLVPIRTRGERIDRIMGSGRDITERLRLEEALRQSQKMEAMGQLTGGIAHDFNNLLGALVGNLDLISRKSGEPEKVRRWAERALEAARRGAKLTSQLLAFSRAQRLQTMPVDVAVLIDEMADLLATTAGPLVTLEYELGADRAVVLSDPTQLEMAVLNLAINARDAMAEGGTLTIGTAIRTIADDPELPPGEYVEVSVGDTGCGMPPEVLSRALDPFFTTKDVGKGTGLGLSQAYGLARQSGGCVRIESALGQGTKVRLLLGRAQGEASAESSGTIPCGDPSGAGARVMVVDDDDDVRAVLVDNLQAFGYEVEEAASGHEALALAARSTFDVALLDFAMPGMTGAEVALGLKAIRPDVPIVFISGYSDTAAIEAAVGAKAVILRKPFRSDDLAKAVESAIRGRAEISV